MTVRIFIWLLLVGLAIASVMSGKLVVALGLACVKAALVGAEYMELRLAHRLHAAAFFIGIVMLALVVRLLENS